MRKHEYEASFRITADNLDIESITAQTRLIPDNTHVKGERKSARQVWPDSLWEISSGLRTNQDLTAHLEALLAQVGPQIEKIRNIAGPKAELFFWCAHYTDAYEGFCGGPILSAKLMKQIGELGVDFTLETYAGTKINA